MESAIDPSFMHAWPTNRTKWAASLSSATTVTTRTPTRYEVTRRTENINETEREHERDLSKRVKGVRGGGG